MHVHAPQVGVFVFPERGLERIAILSRVFYFVPRPATCYACRKWSAGRNQDVSIFS